MTATLTSLKTLQTRQAQLQTKLDAARKAKKSTKSFRDALADLQVEIEAATAAKRSVGRPRTKSEAFYTLRDALKRDGRGRPSRTVVIETLNLLGVEVDETKTSRELEVILKAAKAKALAKAAK